MITMLWRVYGQAQTILTFFWQNMFVLMELSIETKEKFFLKYAFAEYCLTKYKQN